jgi:hypothetical protein
MRNVQLCAATALAGAATALALAAPAAAAPTVTITAHPADPTRETSATFEFQSDDTLATYACSLDGGTAQPCQSGSVTYDNLPDARHHFEVTATDSTMVQTGSATFDWTVDTLPPGTFFAYTPAPFTYERTAHFEFFSEPDATLRCQLDGSGFAGCSSPVDYAGLAPGTHTFYVEATDSAGNTQTPATYGWTVGSSGGGAPCGASSAATARAARSRARIACTPAEPPSGSAATVARPRLVRRGGRLTVDTGIVATGPVDLSTRITTRSGAKRVTVGRFDASLDPGVVRRLRVFLSRRGAKLLRRHGRLALRIAVRVKLGSKTTSVVRSRTVALPRR